MWQVEQLLLIIYMHVHAIVWSQLKLIKDMAVPKGQVVILKFEFLLYQCNNCDWLTASLSVTICIFLYVYTACPKKSGTADFQYLAGQKCHIFKHH